VRNIQPVKPGLPELESLTTTLFASVTFVHLNIARKTFLECHGRPVTQLPVRLLAERLQCSDQPDMGWRALRGQAEQIGAVLDRLKEGASSDRTYPVLTRMTELHRLGPHLTPFPILNISESLDLSIRSVNTDLQYETRCLEAQGLRHLRRERTGPPNWPEERPTEPATPDVQHPPSTTDRANVSALHPHTLSQATRRPERAAQRQAVPTNKQNPGRLAPYTSLVTSGEWARLNGHSSARASRLTTQNRIEGARRLRRSDQDTGPVTATNTLYFVPRNARILDTPVPPIPIDDLISYPAFIRREHLKAADGRYLARRFERCRLGNQHYLHTDNTVTPAMRSELKRWKAKHGPLPPTVEAFIVDLNALNGLKVSVTMKLGKETNPAAARRLQTQLRYIDMTRERAKGTSTGEIARLCGVTRQSVQNATQSVADLLDIRRADQGNPDDEPWGLAPIRASPARTRLSESAKRLLEEARLSGAEPKRPRIPPSTIARLERLNLHVRLAEDVQTETDVVRVTTNGPGRPRVYSRNALRRIFINLRKVMTQIEQATTPREVDALVWKSVSRAAWRNIHTTLIYERRRLLTDLETDSDLDNDLEGPGQNEAGTGTLKTHGDGQQWSAPSGAPHPERTYNAAQNGPQTTFSRSNPGRRQTAPDLNDEARPNRSPARAHTRDA